MNCTSLKVDFSFLEDGKSYTAAIYKDGENAHWDNNPLDYSIENKEITNKSSLDIDLSAGGGFAISLEEK